MTKKQLTSIFTDIADTDYGYKKWFRPTKFAYIVLKDNSLLYIGMEEMWYFDDTDELLYVASALTDGTTGKLSMPTTGVVDKRNVDRLSAIIDFANINQVVLRYEGEYLSGGR